MDEHHIYAVITGDFIRFSDLDQRVRRNMPRLMAEAGSLLRSVLPGVMPKDIDVFRGDSWQAVIEAPVYALRAALLIHAFIRSDVNGGRLNTRMAIGVGTVDYIPDNGVSAGDGPAFRFSGKKLEEMTSSRNFGILGYSNPVDPCEPLVDALMRTVGTLAGRWRPLQAKAVLGILKGTSRAEIAGNRPEPVSVQAVSGHLKRASWPAVLNALEVVERRQKTTL
ncbi:MAG: hypothetical protein K9J85_04305 [Desulfobacteraceae bacterium]|nr:hypothetical protein [Desulfobacteraceae bacterium]